MVNRYPPTFFHVLFVHTKSAHNFTSSDVCIHLTQLLHSIHCHGYEVMTGIISVVNSKQEGCPKK